MTSARKEAIDALEENTNFTNASPPVKESMIVYFIVNTSGTEEQKKRLARQEEEENRQVAIIQADRLRKFFTN